VNARAWRLIHKWSAIIVGIIILMWTFSGIIMVLPVTWYNAGMPGQEAILSFDGADIPPSLAAKRLGITKGGQIGIQEISFRQVLDDLFYQVVLDDGSSHLVNVRTGKLLRITSPIAEQIARAATGSTAKIVSVVRIQEHDLRYPAGPLPTYRIIFEDDLQNSFYVSGLDGNVSKSTALTRLRSAIISLHSFGPVTSILDKEQLRKGLLIIFCMISVVVSFTGYYLFILPIIRKRGKSKGILLTAGEVIKE
jgi:hypothetical protein